MLAKMGSTGQQGWKGSFFQRDKLFDLIRDQFKPSVDLFVLRLSD